MYKAFRNTLRDIFRDGGLLIFIFLVPFVYPLVYAFIYTGEALRELPIAVVDAGQSVASRDYLRRLDATPDVDIFSHDASLAEAEARIERQEAHGILYLPEDFAQRIARGEQAVVRVYCDMAGMLYYKALLSAATNVALDMGRNIKVERAHLSTAHEEEVMAQPLEYEEVALFNPQSGFASFLLPAVLLLIIQQTLALSAGMEAGTRLERQMSTHRLSRRALDLRALFAQAEASGRLPHPIDYHVGRRAWRGLAGRSAAFFLIYIPVVVYLLGVVPRLFSLPQLGMAFDLLLFAVPYLLSCVLLGISLGALVRSRESIILLVVFSSVPLMFLSGVSWPTSAFSWVWRTVASLFPSTHGITGYVRLNSMGASLADVQSEWLWLWGLCLLYGCTAWWATRRNEMLKNALRHP